MDALSVIEATTQIQHHIIRGQLDRVKGDELAALEGGRGRVHGAHGHPR